MNVLLITKPGILLYNILRESKTGWYAIRFYEPIEESYGVFIRIPSLGNAISLTFDLKYYIKRYVSEVLYQIKCNIFCTSSLARMRYHDRTLIFSSPWTYRIKYTIYKNGTIKKELLISSDSGVAKNSFLTGDRQIEVWCSKYEWEILQ